MPAVLATPALPNPFGFDIVGSLLAAIGRALTGGVQSLASSMFGHMVSALVATTSVRLDGWFTGPWRAMVAVAAVFALPLLLAGVATEVLAGRPGQALRRGVLLPLLVGPVLLAARALLDLALAVVNGACGLVVQLGVGGTAGYAQALDRMRSVLGIADGPLSAAAPGGGGIGSLFVVLVAGLLAFVIWIELACRAALVLLLAAFVPLALAGLFWSATTRWTRRLLEVLAAVVLAQLVITVVMVLAAAALAHPADGVATGVDDLAVGLGLLFLGSLGLPLTFRIVPHVVEAAVVTGGGAAAASRLRQGATRLAATAGPLPSARLTAAPAATRTPDPPPGGTLAAAAGTAGPPPAAPRRPPVAGADPAAGPV